MRKHPECKVFWDWELDTHWLDAQNLAVIDKVSQFENKNKISNIWKHNTIFLSILILF